MAKVYGRNSNILVNYARESEMIYATNKSTPLLMWYHWYDDMWYNQWYNDIIDNIRIFLIAIKNLTDIVSCESIFAQIY